MKPTTALKAKKVLDVVAAIAKPAADVLIDDSGKSQSAMNAVDAFVTGGKDVIDVFTGPASK